MKFLSIHLSLKDEVVQLVDFVELKAPPHILENKILKFNNLFHIFPKESIPQITQEITKLVNIDIKKDQVLSKNSSLHLWDRIERISNFKYLPMIFRMAHVLPTSSADMEATFSQVKLIRTAIRNRLKPETPHSLLSICEEFRENNKDKRILIPNYLIEQYDEMIKQLNQAKSISKGNFKSFIFNVNKRKKNEEDLLIEYDENIEDIKQEEFTPVKKQCIFISFLIS